MKRKCDIRCFVHHQVNNKKLDDVGFGFDLF